MWDVKFEVYLSSGSSVNFYINYVRCKAKDLSKILKVDESTAFILTMWDVKMKIILLLQLTNYFFYINYVRCKVFLKYISDTRPRNFYINYVRCKVVPRHNWLIIFPPFILTMWDVKLLTPLFFYSIFSLLY